MIVLRDYQLDVIDRTRSLMAQKRKSILVSSPTGSGKTALASYMVKSASEKGLRSFFCVHRRDLIKQTSMTFKGFDIEHGFIAAGHPYNPFIKTHICSIDTLRNRLDSSPIPNVLFIDECHMSASNSWSKIINFYKEKGAWVIGLTATPIRTDGTGLGIHFSDMVLGPTIRELIDSGNLSKYKLFAPHTPDVSGIKMRGGDFASDQLIKKMIDDKARVKDAVGFYKKLANGTLAVCFCVSIEDSEEAARKFNEAGIPAAHIDGTTPPEQRAIIINKFANRELLVLCNVALMDTGFDLASQVGRDITIETIIDTSPTMSLARQLQKWGRGLRKKDFPAIIIDTAGNSHRHGLPCSDREWTLTDREKKKGGGGSIPVRQCTQCYRCHTPAPVCPSCGFEYPVQYREIEEVEGELRELEISQQKKQDRIEVGRAKTQQELERIADERSYHWGWVKRMCAIRGIHYVPRTFRESCEKRSENASRKAERRNSVLGNP